eukprot:TRINITY_DN3980_c1_g1_i1.p1 TRINITY_DN3980_c1_g1~~TRINITY_DN3980_c1_g1_i1.p1  ORF type:complete len:866 (+),score=233.04 TRINITY_DN3980_c1_g1_i1:42-2639(+)
MSYDFEKYSSVPVVVLTCGPQEFTFTLNLKKPSAAVINYPLREPDDDIPEDNDDGSIKGNLTKYTIGLLFGLKGSTIVIKDTSTSILRGIISEEDYNKTFEVAGEPIEALSGLKLNQNTAAKKRKSTELNKDLQEAKLRWTSWKESHEKCGQKIEQKVQPAEPRLPQPTSQPQCVHVPHFWDNRELPLVVVSSESGLESHSFLPALKWEGETIECNLSPYAISCLFEVTSPVLMHDGKALPVSSSGSYVVPSLSGTYTATGDSHNFPTDPRQESDKRGRLKAAKARLSKTLSDQRSEAIAKYAEWSKTPTAVKQFQEGKTALEKREAAKEQEGLRLLEQQRLKIAKEEKAKQQQGTPTPTTPTTSKSSKKVQQHADANQLQVQQNHLTKKKTQQSTKDKQLQQKLTEATRKKELQEAEAKSKAAQLQLAKEKKRELEELRAKELQREADKARKAAAEQRKRQLEDQKRKELEQLERERVLLERKKKEEEIEQQRLKASEVSRKNREAAEAERKRKEEAEKEVEQQRIKAREVSRKREEDLKRRNDRLEEARRQEAEERAAASSSKTAAIEEELERQKRERIAGIQEKQRAHEQKIKDLAEEAAAKDAERKRRRMADAKEMRSDHHKAFNSKAGSSSATIQSSSQKAGSSGVPQSNTQKGGKGARRTKVSSSPRFGRRAQAAPAAPQPSPKLAKRREGRVKNSTSVNKATSSQPSQPSPSSQPSDEMMLGPQSRPSSRLDGVGGVSRPTALVSFPQQDDETDRLVAAALREQELADQQQHDLALARELGSQRGGTRRANRDVGDRVPPPSGRPPRVNRVSDDEALARALAASLDPDHQPPVPYQHNIPVNEDEALARALAASQQDY